MIDRTHLRNFLNSIPGLEGWSDSVEHLNGVEMLLEALREPTREMLNAGIDAIEDATDWTRDSNESYIATESSDYALPCWKAMWSARFQGK